MRPTSPMPTEITNKTFIEGLQIAVLIPCYNEGLTIGKVVADFRLALPEATIFVYDNCSTDDTAQRACEANAIVRHEKWPGKGNVVRRMFSDVEADIYVMVDGDGTYDPDAAIKMVRLLIAERADMVVGTRNNVYQTAHRRGHGFGNMLFNRIYQGLIGPDFSDIFSGFRVFSRRFVKSFPAVSSGFEIETEMSVHASQIRMPVAEVATDYGVRTEGSVSKLNTFRDALRILKTLLLLYKEIHPARFFGSFSLFFTVVALSLGIPLFKTYIESGLVPRLPTAVAATGAVLLAAMALVCGLILDSLARARLEQKRTLYIGLSQFIDRS